MIETTVRSAFSPLSVAQRMVGMFGSSSSTHMMMIMFGSSNLQARMLIQGALMLFFQIPNRPPKKHQVHPALFFAKNLKPHGRPSKAPGRRHTVFYNGLSRPQSGDSWGVYLALRAINQGLFHALTNALIADSQGLPDSPGLPGTPRLPRTLPWTSR